MQWAEDLTDENEKLKKLLAANFGRLKNNPVKQGKVYEEYEKLCGVRQGSAFKKADGNNCVLSQGDIAKELIETNIRQRGDISSSSLKMERIIKTLEEIYEIKKEIINIQKSNCRKIPQFQNKVQKNVLQQSIN